ncbi:MAG: ankyrin repeat domain-containing protein [Pseudomonadota bacterium]
MAVSIFRELARNMGLAVAIATGTVLAGVAALPVAAQLYSPGYEFLKAVKDRDGDTATKMLNEPGTTIINTRDITTGESGLHIVTQRRDTLWVRFLIQRGADTNLRDKNGRTPIQLATSLNFIDGVEELIKGGAQITVADSQGETPLIAAVHQRSVPLVARFLKEGADPDRNDNSGRSARDYMELMNGNFLMKQEFEAADEERKKSGTPQQYGPSF